MKNQLRIYLADDHAVVRDGILRTLSTFNRVAHVQEARNGNELLTLIKEQEPDIAIVDLEMPGMNGVEAARQIIRHHPAVRILMLSAHTEEVFISRLIDLGVHGFLSKTANPEELEEALYSIMDKDFYRNSVLDKVLLKSHQQAPTDDYNKLTERELEILILICEEFTSAEISDRLQISEKTFFNHRANILTKTGCRNNVGLVKYAYDRDLIKPGSKLYS
jgi:DNA-binding NarL/FixJ family response regulator